MKFPEKISARIYPVRKQEDCWMHQDTHCFTLNSAFALLQLLFIDGGYELPGISVFLHNIVGLFWSPHNALKQSWSDFLQGTAFPRKSQTAAGRQRCFGPGVVLGAENVTGIWFHWVAAFQCLSPHQLIQLSLAAAWPTALLDWSSGLCPNRCF